MVKYEVTVGALGADAVAEAAPQVAQSADALAFEAALVAAAEASAGAAQARAEALRVMYTSEAQARRERRVLTDEERHSYIVAQDAADERRCDADAAWQRAKEAGRALRQANAATAGGQGGPDGAG